MARLQILYLPSNADGDRIDARFGLVADAAADLTEDDRKALRAFASELGAQGCVVLSGVVEVDQGEDDEEAVAALDEMLQGVVQAPIGDQPAAPQAPKLPPPNTTEGKLARSWGYQPVTDPGDPQ